MTLAMQDTHTQKNQGVTFVVHHKSNECEEWCQRQVNTLSRLNECPGFEALSVKENKMERPSLKVS